MYKKYHERTTYKKGSKTPSYKFSNIWVNIELLLINRGIADGFENLIFCSFGSEISSKSRIYDIPKIKLP